MHEAVNTGITTAAAWSERIIASAFEHRPLKSCARKTPHSCVFLDSIVVQCCFSKPCFGISFPGALKPFGRRSALTIELIFLASILRVSWLVPIN